MSEQTGSTTATDGTDSQDQGSQENDFQAITSQEEFDKAIQARIARERAKFGDYEDLKAKASKFDEIEAENQTEAEKAAARAEAAEKRAAELELRAARAEVAAEKGVPADLITGSTKEELEASADALIKFKSDATRADYSAPNEGRGDSAGSSSTADQFARFMQKQLK